MQSQEVMFDRLLWWGEALKAQGKDGRRERQKAPPFTAWALRSARAFVGSPKSRIQFAGRAWRLLSKKSLRR